MFCNLLVRHFIFIVLLYFNKVKQALFDITASFLNEESDLTRQRRKAAHLTAETNAHVTQVCHDVTIALMRSNLDQRGASADEGARSLMWRHLELLSIVMEPSGDS